MINFDLNYIKVNYENYTYDLLLFFKKFFFFNRYLKKYFNLYDLNQRLLKYSKINDDKFSSILTNLKLRLNSKIKSRSKKKICIKSIMKKKFIKYKY